MKKIFSILIALVLVISLCLTPAMVSASPGGIELTKEGDGTASWSSVEQKFGAYSVELSLPAVPAGSNLANAARVVIEADPDTVLNAITSFNFWWKNTTTANRMFYPYVIFEMDVDDDGVKDTWVINYSRPDLEDDMFDGPTDWAERSLPTHNDKWFSVSTISGYSVSQFEAETFAGIKAVTDGYGSLGDQKILKYKVAVGEWGPIAAEYTAAPNYFIDDITINGVIYALETATGQLDMTAIFTAPPVIGISVDVPSVDFGDVIPGEPKTSDPATVTVTNTGNVDVDLSATIENESPVGIYTGTPGLTISTTHINTWQGSALVGQTSGSLPLELTVPDPTEPGTYTATLVFWATAQ